MVCPWWCPYATRQRLFYDHFTVVTDLPPRSSRLSVVAVPSDANCGQPQFAPPKK